MLEVLLQTTNRAPGGRLGSREANVEMLQKETGLARGTVHNALRHLSPVLNQRSHWQDRAQGRRGGKPTTMHSVARDAAEVVVLDLDHDRISMSVSDAFGNLKSGGEIPVAFDAAPAQTIDAASKLILRYPSLDWDKVAGIGLSIPAPVDPDSQRTVGGVLPSWEGGDVEKLLYRRLEGQIKARRPPIIADNDGNLACLAEHRFGYGEGSSDTSLMFVKTVRGKLGIGAGAVVNGSLIRGRGLAMELGHKAMSGPLENPSVEPCPHCLRRDCLQVRLSTEALIGGDPPPDWEEVVNRTFQTVDPIVRMRQAAAETGDRVVEQRMSRRLTRIARDDRDVRAIVAAGQEMGRALADVVTLLDPDVIAIGGPLGRAWLKAGVSSLSPVIGDPVGDALWASLPLDRTKRECSLRISFASSAGDCARGAAAAVLDKHLVSFLLWRSSVLDHDIDAELVATL